MQALNKTKNHYTSVQLAWPSSGTFPNRRDLITWRNMTAPLQPARIMQRWSNTTWRGKFQGRSHHFCNNYIGRCSMSFSYMLDDAHAGLSHRPPLLQNELSVPSSTQLYCSKGRNTGWCLWKCPGHFPHRSTGFKVAVSILQKSGLLSGAMHCTLLILFSHTPHYQAATPSTAEQSLKSTFGVLHLGKQIKWYLWTTEYKLFSWRKVNNIWCIPHILCSFNFP